MNPHAPLKLEQSAELFKILEYANLDPRNNFERAKEPDFLIFRLIKDHDIHFTIGFHEYEEGFTCTYSPGTDSISTTAGEEDSVPLNWRMLVHQFSIWIIQLKKQLTINDPWIKDENIKKLQESLEPFAINLEGEATETEKNAIIYLMESLHSKLDELHYENKSEREVMAQHFKNTKTLIKKESSKSVLYTLVIGFISIHAIKIGIIGPEVIVLIADHFRLLIGN